MSGLLYFSITSLYLEEGALGEVPNGAGNKVDCPEEEELFGEVLDVDHVLTQSWRGRSGSARQAKLCLIYFSTRSL